MNASNSEKPPHFQQGLLPTVNYGRNKLNRGWRVAIGGLVLVCSALSWLLLRYYGGAHGREVQTAAHFSATSYSHLAEHCGSVPLITHSEFLSRQVNLAKILDTLRASAYIAEPGANTQFFGNFSKAQWSLSERPLLLIVAPVASVVVATEVRARIIVLTPKFEATRAKTLPIPSADDIITYVEWAEDENPYAKALSALPPAPQGDAVTRTIFVDNSIRKFIVDGLYRASASEPNFSALQDHLSVHSKDNITRTPIQVVSAPFEVTQLRERKSETELKILKCVNEVTLLAIRDVHKKLVPGIHESYAQSMMSIALGAAGLKDGGCLTLFGENAALPHGSGTDRTLVESDFVLFDCTASLHGYYSDVTRTIALSRTAPLSAKQVDLWHRVRAAQIAAVKTARNGTLTRAVDAAARATLHENGGWDRYFTHRLGHGIGLEVHEAPYLRGGSDDIIQVGHTFSDEPGAYIEGEVGVRLEDCFFINADGVGEFLTAEVGGISSAPWLP